MKKVSFLTSTAVTIVFLFIALSVAIVFFACKKEGKEKMGNACPVVAAGLVPQIVKDSFAVRYPATTVITWFNKDSVAFCAYFITINNVDKLAQFEYNGNFIREEIEILQEGEHQKSTGAGGKIIGGCECETHKETD